MLVHTYEIKKYGSVFAGCTVEGDLDAFAAVWSAEVPAVSPKATP